MSPLSHYLSHLYQPFELYKSLFVLVDTGLRQAQ